LSSLAGTGGTVVPFQVNGSSALKAREAGEARTAPRRKVFKAGTAASNNRHLTVSCTVRDLSTTGARLRVDNVVSIPDTFELIIAVDGLEANCEVVWRKTNDVGVRFIGAPRMVAAKRAQVIGPLVPTEPPSLRRKPKPDSA
jgi:PilZ domain